MVYVLLIGLDLVLTGRFGDRSLVLGSVEWIRSRRANLFGMKSVNSSHHIADQHTTNSWDPVHVVNRIVQATTLVDPMPQYLIGMDGRFGLMPLVHNSPLNFQFVFVMNTFFRKLIPAAVRNKGEAAAVAAGGALLPTTVQPDDRSR